MNEILRPLLAALRKGLGGRFATYEQGKRAVIGDSEMPLLCVYPLRTSQRRSGTGNDDATFRFGVSAVLSASPRATGDSRSPQCRTQADLADAFEGRDPADCMKAKAATVVGVLNANLTLGGRVLYLDEIDIAYDSEFDAKGTTERVTCTCVAHARPPR